MNDILNNLIEHCTFQNNTMGIPVCNAEKFEGYQKDAINPDHYKNQTSLECIEAMEIIFGRDAVIDFCRCNAWKYIWRWKNKNGTEDLKKAKWYLQRAFNMLDGGDKRMDIVRGMIHYIGWSVEDKVEEESDG